MAQEASIEIKSLGNLTGALNWAAGAISKGLQAGPVVMVLRRPNRSTAQNRLLWSRLKDISEQVEWWGRRLSDEQYKDLLSAGLLKQEVIPNISGDGFVVLGQRTSKMSTEMFSALLDLCKVFGDERGVKWSPTSLGEEGES